MEPVDDLSGRTNKLILEFFMKQIFGILFILLFFNACSQDNQIDIDHPRKPPRRGRLEGSDRPMFDDLKRMKRDLDLTDAQVDSIQSINDSFSEEHKKIQQLYRPKRQELGKLLREESVDFEKVKIVLMEIAEIDVERQLLIIKQRLEIERLLTNEQREKIRKPRKEK
jgi:Spy/CpxP family protein refolding chaperone